MDVVDNRCVSDGYDFHRVEGVALPFADASFDVVISNHVIEHVGDVEAQESHLSEIRRVMKSDGVGYLAVPNRWMLIEPHYRLVFLSWWPRGWRTPYLRLIRGEGFYDCEPLVRRQIERMLDGAELAHRNLCIEALRETLAIEFPEAMITRWLGVISDRALRPLRGIIPTLIYRLDRNIPGASPERGAGE